MRMSDIFIQKCMICLFDAGKVQGKLTEISVDPGEEQGRFICQLVLKYLEDINAKTAPFEEDSFLGEMLTQEEPFDRFAAYAAQEIHHLMENNPEIQQGTGIFIDALLGEEENLIFFKLNYQAGFICQSDEEGMTAWQRSTRLLPAAGKKLSEYLYLNLARQTVRISDYTCYVDAEPMNYLAAKICQLEPKQSEKETVEAITDAIAATIEEKYAERIPEKILASKKEVARIAEEKGSLAAEDITAAVFADNEEAADRYREKVVEERLPKEPVPISGKMEKRLQKKQKIVTNSGIEILVPLEFLQDETVFEYVRDEEGRVCIMIKGVQ